MSSRKYTTSGNYAFLGQCPLKIISISDEKYYQYDTNRLIDQHATRKIWVLGLSLGSANSQAMHTQQCLVLLHFGHNQLPTWWFPWRRQFSSWMSSILQRKISSIGESKELRGKSLWEMDKFEDGSWECSSYNNCWQSNHVQLWEGK